MDSNHILRVQSAASIPIRLSEKVPVCSGLSPTPLSS